MKSLFVIYMFIAMLCTLSAQTMFLKEYKIGDSLYKNFQYDSALIVLEHVLIYTNIPDSLKAEIWNKKGVMLAATQADDNIIIGYYRQALAVFKKENNLTKQSRVLSNIGNFYLSKRDYFHAIEYQQSALKLSQQDIDSLRLYFNLCQIYQWQKDFKNVYDIIAHHILLFKKEIVPNQAYLVTSNLGLYYNGINKHDSALFHYKKALLEARSDNLLTAGYDNISDEYLAAKNYKEAISYLDSAYLLIIKTGDLQSLLITYDSYRDIYLEMKNTFQAIKYAQLGRQLSDSIFKLDNAKAMQESEVKYQTKQKEDRIVLLDIEKVQQNRNFVYSLIGLALVALLAAISFRSYKQKQKANNILTVQRNQVQQLANELEVANQTKARLFSTIGHDLRSPISSLYALLKMQEINGSNNMDAAAMSSQTINLLDTLEDLLVWSKTQMDRFVPMPVRVNIHGFYNELTDFFAGTAMSKNVQIINESEAGLTFRCDENILRTMLRNAIGNALNHTGAGGNVILSAMKTKLGLCVSSKTLAAKLILKAFNQLLKMLMCKAAAMGLAWY